MKKIVLVILVVFSVYNVSAQEEEIVEEQKKYEISANLLDLVVAGTLNVNYERLFEKNQSLHIGVSIFDTYAYYDVGSIDNTTAVSVRAAYLIYFSKDKDHHGFFFYPQIRARIGEVTVEDFFYFYDSNYTEATETSTYDIAGFGVGFGIGHKWMFDNKFTLALDANIARNLGDFDTNYLTDLELRFGVNLGYRF
jgi:hypothetical protein